MRDAASATTLLTTADTVTQHGEALSSLARRCGARLELVGISRRGDPLDAPTLERIEIGFLPPTNVDMNLVRRFFGVALRAPKLRWLHVGFTGVDDPIFQRVANQGVTLTNSPGATAEPIALNALTGLLSLARGFPRWGEAQRRRHWSPTRPEQLPEDLREQTLLILGLGSIGNRLAQLARALGMRTIGIRRSPARPEDAADELHPPAALPELLPRAQWLAITCPLTDQTRGWIDAAALRSLPRGAHLINVARGAIVDERALERALEDGHLAGAYLDVFQSEPLPDTSPLWSLPSVIVTPHDAHASSRTRERTTEIYTANLTRWLRGEPLLHIVGGSAT